MFQINYLRNIVLNRNHCTIVIRDVRKFHHKNYLKNVFFLFQNNIPLIYKPKTLTISLFSQWYKYHINYTRILCLVLQ